MARYQLRMHGWSIGQWFIPEGTIIDDTGTDQWSALVKSKGIVVPPLTAQPLDQDAYAKMKNAYGELMRWVVTGDGVVR
jgi:hypothetical protein